MKNIKMCCPIVNRSGSHKTFWHKFTHSFLKAISFHNTKNNDYINGMVLLTKKFMPKKFYAIYLRFVQHCCHSRLVNNRVQD